MGLTTICAYTARRRGRWHHLESSCPTSCSPAPTPHQTNARGSSAPPSVERRTTNAPARSVQQRRLHRSPTVHDLHANSSSIRTRTGHGADNKVHAIHPNVVTVVVRSMKPQPTHHRRYSRHAPALCIWHNATAFRAADVKSSLARVAIGCKKQGAVVKIGETSPRCVQPASGRRSTKHAERCAMNKSKSPVGCKAETAPPFSVVVTCWTSPMPAVQRARRRFVGWPFEEAQPSAGVQRVLAGDKTNPCFPVSESADAALSRHPPRSTWAY